MTAEESLATAEDPLVNAEDPLVTAEDPLVTAADPLVAARRTWLTISRKEGKRKLMMRDVTELGDVDNDDVVRRGSRDVDVGRGRSW